MARRAGNAEDGLGDPAEVSEAELRWALDHALFETLFQPIVRVSDGLAVGMEALARLNHPEHGTVEPDRFVPRIETAGLALALAGQIASQALSALPAGFLEANALCVAVNLPLDVFLRDDALPALDRLRLRHGVPEHCLSVELTESQPVVDLAELGRAIERWRAAGYALALDDIGPEMRNRRALLDLPFTAVKLDKPAVQACLATGPDDFLPRTIVAASARGLTVIAEGVEDAATWHRIAALGADQVQGFLVARPLPADHLPPWLAAWRASPGQPR